MKNVLMYGYGGAGRKLIQMIRDHGEISLLGVIDQRAETLRSEHPEEHFYTFEEVRDTSAWQEADSILVSAGNPEAAEDIFRKLENGGQQESRSAMRRPAGSRWGILPRNGSPGSRGVCSWRGSSCISWIPAI